MCAACMIRWEAHLCDTRLFIRLDSCASVVAAFVAVVLVESFVCIGLCTRVRIQGIRVVMLMLLAGWRL